MLEHLRYITRWPGATLAAAAAVLTTACPHPARGVLVALDASASIRINPAYAPPELTGSDFSIVAWVWRGEGGPGSQAVLQFPGVFELVIQGDDAVEFIVHRPDPIFPGLRAQAPCAVPVGEWTLLVGSFSRADGRADVFALSQTAGAAAGTRSSTRYQGKDLGPVEGELALGAHYAGLPGMPGALGVVGVRRQSLTQADVDRLWNDRRYLGAYDTDNSASGGSLDGIPGCAWMIGHAITTAPIDGGVGGTQPLRAAVVGQPAGFFNVHIFDAAGSVGQYLNVVRPVTSVSGFVYASHREPPYDGFFTSDLPGTGIPVSFVPGTAPRTRELASVPRGTRRVMVSANSRAVRGYDGSGLSPGNYAHGFIDLNLPRVSGVLFRPAVLNSGGSPWFGFDTKDHNPRQSEPGTIRKITDEDAGPTADLCRFFTGSRESASRGPGNGLLLLPGSYYSLRCKPEPGSLILATEPLTVEAYVLRFPGASGLTWQTDQGKTQSAPGSQGPPQTETLDTTRLTHVLAPTDAFSTDTTLTLDADYSAQISPGDACTVGSGPYAGAISAVTGVALDSGRTVLTLSHPFYQRPREGDTLLFGSWSFLTIRHEWGGLRPEDQRVWRGIQINADPDGRLGVLVLAYSAWRPGVDGFVFGTAGWSGHGYAEQIAAAIPGSIAAWAALAAADVWVQVPAQQGSLPASMADFTARVRQWLPDCEVVWAGEMEHGTGPQQDWHQYILDQASAHGAVGLSLLEHPLLGTLPEQFADGLRAEDAHLSARGNLVLARLWTEQLARAAVDPCLRADFNLDGYVNTLDFVLFLNDFNAGMPTADWDSNGVVNTLDLLSFLNDFNAAC